MHRFISTLFDTNVHHYEALCCAHQIGSTFEGNRMSGAKLPHELRDFNKKKTWHKF
jgi:hypothetical protein